MLAVMGASEERALPRAHSALRSRAGVLGPCGNACGHTCASGHWEPGIELRPKARGSDWIPSKMVSECLSQGTPYLLHHHAAGRASAARREQQEPQAANGAGRMGPVLAGQRRLERSFWAMGHPIAPMKSPTRTGADPLRLRIEN